MVGDCLGSFFTFFQSSAGRIGGRASNNYLSKFVKAEFLGNENWVKLIKINVCLKIVKAVLFVNKIGCSY